MKKFVVLFLIIFILNGCAIATDIYLPDGSKGLNISCDGSANNISRCFQKAGDICGTKGYNLINREGELVPFYYGNANISGNQGQSISQFGMFVHRNIIIKCKE